MPDHEPRFLEILMLDLPFMDVVAVRFELWKEVYLASGLGFYDGFVERGWHGPLKVYFPDLPELHLVLRMVDYFGAA